MKTDYIPKREVKLWTYIYLNNTKAQLDYILLNKKWINGNLNCEVYSSFEGVSSHHRIVTAKICLSLPRNKKQIDKTTDYNCSSLTNRDISNKYTVTVRNKFDTLQKDIFRMTNMKISSLPTWKQQQSACQPNQEPSVGFHRSHE